MTTRRVVAGWTVCAQPGRVWLHHDGLGDGDMPPAIATQLAAALTAAALEALDEDTPVRLAHQPSWPFEYAVRAVATVPDVPTEPWHGERQEQVVYLVEGEQTRYLPGEVAEAIGWGR